MDSDSEEINEEQYKKKIDKDNYKKTKHNPNIKIDDEFNKSQLEDVNISRRVKAQMATHLIKKEKVKTFDNLKFSCNPELEKFMQLNNTN